MYEPGSGFTGKSRLVRPGDEMIFTASPESFHGNEVDVTIEEKSESVKSSQLASDSLNSLDVSELSQVRTG